MLSTIINKLTGIADRKNFARFAMRYIFVGLFNTILAWGVFELLIAYVGNHISFASAFVFASAINIFLHGQITARETKNKKKFAVIAALYSFACLVSFTVFEIGLSFGLSDTISYLLTIPAYQLAYGTSLYLVYLIGINQSQTQKNSEG
jgi:putative flippase GtrA